MCYTHHNDKLGRLGRKNGCVSLKKINAFLLQRPTLLLTLVWVFALIAIGIGVTLNLVCTTMGLLRFWGYIIIPAALALYTRVLYSKVQRRRKEGLQAQKEAENKARYQHKKKKH